MSNATYKQDLHDIAIAVAQNSKNYTDKVADDLRWELGTYDLSVDSDTTSAYQKVVPANSIEAKINTLGCMSYKCNNLFSLDNTSITIPAGSEQWYNISNETLKSMGLINGNTYTIKGNNAPSSMVYQKLPNYNGFDTNALSFTMDDNITLRIGNNTVPQDVTFNLQVMLNSGSTALPYEPYYSGIRDTAITSVKSVGVNLAGGTIIENQGYSQDGGTYSSNDTNIMSLLEVKPNTTYSKNNSLWLNYYDENQAFISQDSGDTFTTPSNCKYIGITIPKTTPNLMLNYGSSALPYKEYVGTIDTLSIPAQVQALDGYGQSNPDDATEYNYIDFNAKIFVRVGYIDNGVWVASALTTDISAYLTTNKITVEGGGTLTAENIYGASVPGDIDYLKEVAK